MLDINGMRWAADSFQLWSQPFPPNPLFNCQKTSRLFPSQCWMLAASDWRQWWDLGNNCYSRLRMEMRMTFDWQSTLLGGLSSLFGIKVKPWRRDDSMWQVYDVWTCWVCTDLSVTSRRTGGEAFATGDQIVNVCFFNDAFRKPRILKIQPFFSFLIWFSNKLNIIQKMQIHDISRKTLMQCTRLAWTSNKHTHTLCRRMPTVSLQWFT